MTTLSADVKINDDLTIKVEVTCTDGVIGWAEDCAKKLKEAIDAVKKVFAEPADGGER
jgi:hypothetical protein